MRSRDEDAGEGGLDGEDARTSAPSEVNPIVPSGARAKSAIAPAALVARARGVPPSSPEGVGD
jgi:hypothetical protein